MAVAGLDIAIATVVLLSAAIGLVRGLVKEVLSLVSWAAAFVVAIYFSPLIAQQLPPSWGAESVRLIIGFAVLFIATLILAAMLQWLIAQLVSSTGLSGTDRFLGLLFGSARGLLICVVLLMGLREIAAERSWWQASMLQAELLTFEDEVRDLLGRARDMVREVPNPMSVKDKQLNGDA
jgi:membrane protein required for colicin V production